MRLNNPGRCAEGWKVNKGLCKSTIHAHSKVLLNKLPYHRIRAVLLQRRRESHIPDCHINNFVRHFVTGFTSALWLKSRSVCFKSYLSKLIPPTSACQNISFIKRPLDLKSRLYCTNSSDESSSPTFSLPNIFFNLVQFINNLIKWWFYNIQSPLLQAQSSISVPIIILSQWAYRSKNAKIKSL